MNAKLDMTLDELAAEATQLLADHGLLGAAPDGRVAAAPDGRTIRYYTTLGLLDRPLSRTEGSGRQARYGQRHLAQILAVKALQAAGLPLAEVQARLYGLTDGELASIVNAAVPPGAAEPEYRPLVWREIVVEPGLKLSAEMGWSPSLPPEEMERRIRAALAAFSSHHQPGGAEQ